MTSREKKDSVSAAAITFLAALILLLILFFGSLSIDRSALAADSMPEPDEPQTLFITPELLEISDPGTEQTTLNEEAAPQLPGMPDPAPEEQPVPKLKAEKPVEKPVPAKEPLVSQKKKESDVRQKPTAPSDEERKRVESMQGKFKSDNNGSLNGKDADNAGAGGNGVASSGKLNGRKMLSCPSSKVRLSQKTTVTVRITVNAEGHVTSASAQSGGTPNLRKVCEGWARQSRWSPKPGAAPAGGTITFTITPR